MGDASYLGNCLCLASNVVKKLNFILSKTANSSLTVLSLPCHSGRPPSSCPPLRWGGGPRHERANLRFHTTLLADPALRQILERDEYAERQTPPCPARGQATAHTRGLGTDKEGVGRGKGNSAVSYGPW